MVAQAKTVEKMEAFIREWSKADNLIHAHELAKTGIKSDRSQRRFRRKVEKEFGIQLAAHNPKYSSEDDLVCPSTLNVDSIRDGSKFVVVSCTNNSEVDTGFFNTLLQFCDKHEAQLLIKPVRYKNPSAIHSNEDYKWDERIYPYVLNESFSVGINCVIQGDVNIQATAVNPLSGMQEVGGGRNAVYGHPQIGTEPIATPKSEMTRFMHTTGSLNNPSYSATKDGAKAAFHHSMGALFIHVIEDFHYPVHLNWDGSSFNYMHERYFDGGFEDVEVVPAYVSGDIHADWEDHTLTQRKIKLMDALKVEAHYLHDLHNQTVCSHHNTVRERVEMAQIGKVFVEDEVKTSFLYILKTGRKYNYLVGSNHNDHMDKWLDRFRDDQDPSNAVYAAKLKARMYGSGMSALETAFSYLREELKTDTHVEFLDRDVSHMVSGVDLSQHGDVGINGARGSTAAFARTCRRVIKGHDHTPRISKGSMSVGFSFIESKAGYAKSYSTWAQGDAWVYATGKRCLFIWGKNSGVSNPHFKYATG